MQIARGVVFLIPFKNSASPLSKRVFTEIINIERASNIWWRGRSFSTYVPSDIPKAQKGRKRVTKHERQAMVESFVNKYRTMNAGKFPTASSARKEVGGSYYCIRKFLQEMEYKSKFSYSDKRNEDLLVKEQTREHESLTKVEEVSNSQMPVDLEIRNDSQTSSINCVEIGHATAKHLEAKGESQNSSWAEKNLFKVDIKSHTEDDHSDFVPRKSHLQEKETRNVSHPSLRKVEHSKKEEEVAEYLQDFDGPNYKTKQDQGSPKLDSNARRDCELQRNGEEVAKKSTMWGNLKRLVDGIINIWRN